MYGLFKKNIVCVLDGLRGQLHRLETMQAMNKRRHKFFGLDLIDHMHAQMINTNQHLIEHDGLEYWLNQSVATYNPLLQHYYLQPGNSFFREEYSAIVAA